VIYNIKKRLLFITAYTTVLHLAYEYASYEQFRITTTPSSVDITIEDK